MLFYYTMDLTNVNPTSQESRPLEKRFYFVCALVCWAVGISNCWRFPVLAAANGGSAFLIPYTLTTAFITIPFVYAYIGLGQYGGLGTCAVWKICPLMKGVGWSSIYINAVHILFYNCLGMYTLYYLYISITQGTPWTECGQNWARENCVTYATNLSILQQCEEKNGLEYCQNINWQDSARHFWLVYVLDKLPPSVPSLGSLRLPLAICLLIFNLALFIIARKGLHTIEKYLPFFCFYPFIGLSILLLVSLTEPGSMEGITTLLAFEEMFLLQRTTWQYAAEVIFSIMGIGLGGLITFGSYCQFRSPAHMDSITVTLFSFFCSILFSVLVASSLGSMCYKEKLTFRRVLFMGDNLLFVSLPQSFSYIKGSAQMWSVIFFSSLLILCLRFQMFITANLVKITCDLFSWCARHRVATCGIVCLTSFLIGLLTATQGGTELLNMFDPITSGPQLLLVSFFQIFTIMWLYGIQKFIDDQQFMLGFRCSLYWKITWVLGPFLVLFYSICGLTEYITDEELWPAHTWSRVVQVIANALPTAFIFSRAIFELIQIKSIKVIKPEPSWGPKDEVLKKSRDMFSSYSMTKEYLYRQQRLNSRQLVSQDSSPIL